jgi:hypothetical protein
MGNVKVVLNRKAFKEQILHNATLLDDVQEQMEGMAEVHRAITVYRNDDRDTGNVVATAPARVEAEHGVLTQMLGMVRV